MCFGAGCVILTVMFCVVGGCVNDDDGVCEVVGFHMVECALKSECFVHCDFVLLLGFVAVSVDFVHCRLYFICCCVFIVAVVVKVDVLCVVDVVAGEWLLGRRRSMAEKWRCAGERSEQMRRGRRRI